jgi:phosphate:Na+ symporter
MTALLALVDLAGYVALLLWGVHMVQSGVERALGADLRRVLAVGLGTRAKAFASGLGVTAILQSSTATGLIVSGFAAAGMIDLVPALAAMLGANVGTTLIVQVLTFNVMAVVPILFLAGIVLFRRAPTKRIHDFGRVSIGLGLVLVALDRMVAAVMPLESLPAVREAIVFVAGHPVLALVAAALFTWAAHSSVATVLLVGSLATAGIVPIDGALAMVLGANLGTAVNPVLESQGGRDPSARRVPVGNFLNRLVCCLVALPLLPLLTPLVEGLEPDADRRVANFHTAFNLIAAAVFLPLLDPFARLLTRLFPARPTPPDPTEPQFLDAAMLGVPSVAIEAAGREAGRVADAVAAMLAALPAAAAGDAAAEKAIARNGAVASKLSDAVRDYLDRLDNVDLAPRDRGRLIATLVFVGNVDHAGETVAEAFGHVLRRAPARAALAAEPAVAEIAARLAAGTQSAAAAYAEGAASPPSDVAALEAEVGAAVEKASEAHYAALQAGQALPAQVSAVVVDVLRDLDRVAGFLVAAVEDPMADGANDEDGLIGA